MKCKCPHNKKFKEDSANAMLLENPSEVIVDGLKMVIYDRELAQNVLHG